MLSLAFCRYARMVNKGGKAFASRRSVKGMKRLTRFTIVGVLAVLVPYLLIADSNPAVGTWKLNLKKSKPGGAPLPKSETLTVEARGDGVKVDYDGLDADGEGFSYGYLANFDGKDNPMSGSGQPADTIAIERIDPNTYKSTLKKAGQVTATVEILVSKNGKVTTLTVKGTDANGQPTIAVNVFEKQ